MPTEETFTSTVLACVEEINALLPQLAARYPDLVMVTALAEHVGGALRLCLRDAVCSPEQARQLLAHMDFATFSDRAAR